MLTRLSFFLFICYFSYGKCFGQNNYENFQNLVINDSPVLDSLTKRLRNKGVTTFLVYQPVERSSVSSARTTASTSTFLAWTRNKLAYSQLITADSICNPVRISNNIFAYKDKYRCGVMKYEANLQFVPPIFSTDKSAFIAYCSPKATFYFEGGQAITYTTDIKRVAYRNAWINMINTELLSTALKSRRNKSYKRVYLSSLYNCHCYIFGKK